MSTEYRLSFPTKEHRNRFLRLVAQNVGEYGYGLGMEFEGLEHVIESSSGHGRIQRTIPGKQAYGSWVMNGSELTLDLGNIAHMDQDFDRLEERLESVARQFGAS